MSLNFETVSLGEHLYIKGRIGWKGLKKDEYLDQGNYRIINATALEEEGINWDDCGYISKERFEESPEIILKDKDILISKDGTIGKLGYVKNLEMDSTVASGIFVVRNQNEEYIDTDFLYYYFKSPFFKWFIKSVTEGSVIPHLYQRDFRDMEFNLFNLDTQKKCSSILNAIEEKINVNRKINKNLEQLMKCIFEDWFVNFNYSNDISFKSSELGEIPSNWNVKKLRDVLIVLESGKRPKGGISNIDDGIPSIGAENILGLGKFNYSKNKLISHEFFSTLKKGVIQDKDVLLYKDGAQLGRKSLFMKGFPFDICCINEHVFRLQSNDEINQFYLYLWLDQEVMTNEIINLNSNSAQPGINQNDVKSLPILVPELKIISKFNKIISPMMNQIFDNALKINKLTNLRDTLLPKLMSGEIDVSKINCDLELKYNYMKYLFNQIHTPMSKSVV